MTAYVCFSGWVFVSSSRNKLAQPTTEVAYTDEDAKTFIRELRSGRLEADAPEPAWEFASPFLNDQLEVSRFILHTCFIQPC